MLKGVLAVMLVLIATANVVTGESVSRTARPAGEQLPGESGHSSQIQEEFSYPLTLDQCIEIGLRRSPDIRIADLDLESARLSVSDAFSRYLPEVDVSGQYRFSDKIDFGWERPNYDAAIGASYTIWDHGNRKTQMERARANETGVLSDHERIRQALIFSITQSYYDLLEAEKLIDVYKALLEISKGNVEKTAAFEKSGEAIPADVAAARAQQANDELALISAENNVAIAKARLASLLGLDPATAIEISKVDYEIQMQPDETGKQPSLEELVSKAINNRPEMRGMKASIAALKASLKQAQLDRWPVITAECNFGVSLADYLRDRGSFKKYRNWDAVARLTFPIFDGGTSKRREQNAQIAVKRTEESMKSLKRTLALEVQQAYLGMERARKSLDIAQKQVKNATESLNVTQARYKQNMVIFLEVLSAQARYAQALTNQVKAYYDYKMAEKALEKAAGTLEAKK